MTSTATASITHSWTNVDVQKVVRRCRADLAMIAQSTAATTEEHAGKWADDIETLAREGYLSAVDLTLFSGNVEVQAARFDVTTEAGELQMSRPGGVAWPRVPNPRLRLILHYTSSYTDEAAKRMSPRLKLGWVSTTEDTTHASLRKVGARDYASNGWGIQRTDFGK